MNSGESLLGAPPPAPSIDKVNPELLGLVPHLEALSEAWVQEAVNSANGFLFPQKYTIEEWQTFFDYYFSNHHFTPDLWNYLNYPVFSWGGDNHETLQTSLLNVSILWLHRQLFKFDVENGTLSAELGKSQDYRFAFKHHLFIANRIFIEQKISSQNFLKAYQFFKAMLNTLPIFKLTSPIDTEDLPYIAALRANILWLMKLTQAVENSIYVSDTGISGFNKDMLLKYDVLLLYNFGWTEPHKEAIKKYFEIVPQNLNTVELITGADTLDNKHSVDGGEQRWLFLYNAVRGVNIGDWNYAESPFPNEVEPHIAPSYLGILQHELNHVTHGDYVTNNPELLSRHSELISQAGAVSKQYLRSLVTDYEGADFFINNPQEFFASISNMYFTNSFKTLQVGLIRFDSNFKEPINQFLFFADVYSQGGNNTLFFTASAEYGYKAQEVIITRDENGHINSLAYEGVVYNFTLDENGNVLSYSGN